MRSFHYVNARLSRLAVATLTGAGWSYTAIAAATGLSDNTIGDIANGIPVRVHDTTEAAILAVDPLHFPTVTIKALEPFVSRVGSVRRIQALLAMGHTHERMSAIVWLQTGVCGFQTRSFVHRTTAGLCLLSTHLKVADMYRYLAVRPGTSELTRQRARARGYLSPAYWDDIDYDPTPDWGDVA